MKYFPAHSLFIRLRTFLAAVAATAVLSLGPPSASAQNKVGTAVKVVNKVYGNSLNKPIRIGDGLIRDQKVRTGRESATDIRLLDDTTLLIGERTDIVLDDLLVDPDALKLSGRMELVRGILRFSSAASVKVDLEIITRLSTIGVRGTRFDLYATSAETQIAVLEGAVDVTSAAGTERVEAGQVYRVAATGNAGFSAAMSAAMEGAVAKMLSLVGVAPDGGIGLQAVYAGAIKGKNLDNILYLDLAWGRIVIEMLPATAPRHVKRIKELVRRKFYDGLIFHNVVKGFAAETGDPGGRGTGGSGQKIDAEFSAGNFVRGTVGMKRHRSLPNSADSQFFITLGPASHLDGRYTMWGKVIHGIGYADRLALGSPPKNPDKILSVRVAADVAK